jgi:hypothetical protein
MDPEEASIKRKNDNAKAVYLKSGMRKYDLLFPSQLTGFPASSPAGKRD